MNVRIEAELLTRQQDGVAWLTLNRPAARNALSVALMTALDGALDGLAEFGDAPGIGVGIVGDAEGMEGEGEGDAVVGEVGRIDGDDGDEGHPIDGDFRGEADGEGIPAHVPVVPAVREDGGDDGNDLDDGFELADLAGFDGEAFGGGDAA